MLTSDERFWNNATDNEIIETAKIWAKDRTTKQLRSFQSAYGEYKQTLGELTEEELKGKVTERTMKFNALTNMERCATGAISIREFPKESIFLG